MDVYAAIANRFSVREYADRPVEDDKLHRILDAGRLAPSGCNRQAWKFVVVRGAELRGSLAQAAQQSFVGEAPVVIAVVGLDPKRIMHCGMPADPVDCAIATDHMTLASTAEGLGTCWIGHFDQDACRQLLGVPDGAMIVELMLLGYPSVDPRAKARKQLDDVVCYERFK